MIKRIAFILLLPTVAMATVAVMNAFSSGEITPRLYGRTDTRIFYVGAREMENMFVKAMGPASKRPGSYYVAAAPGPGRLISFERATGADMVLELSGETMRIYVDD